MKRVIIILAIAFAAFIAGGFLIASPETRQAAEAVWLAALVMLALLVVGAGIIGLYWMFMYAVKSTEIRPDDNGWYPVIRTPFGYRNLNLVGSEGVNPLQWIILHLTKGKVGTQPREVFNMLSQQSQPQPLALPAPPPVRSEAEAGGLIIEARDRARRL